VTPDAARSLLDAERRRTEQRLAQLRADHRGFVEASRDSNADDEHDAEGTTIALRYRHPARPARGAADGPSVRRLRRRLSDRFHP
jgi:hypothetical protein